MTEREFCYWLQGFMEMADPKGLSEQQIQMIKQHLALVFTNVTGTITITTPSSTSVPYPLHSAPIVIC